MTTAEAWEYAEEWYRFFSKCANPDRWEDENIKALAVLRAALEPVTDAERERLTRRFDLLCSCVEEQFGQPNDQEKADITRIRALIAAPRPSMGAHEWASKYYEVEGE